MKNVYVFRNRKISAYLDPFFKVEEKDVVARDLQRFCILEKAEAIKNHFEETELYLMGTYDDENGQLDLLDQKEFICDLGTFFPKN